MSNVIAKLDELENALKHQPGRHDQQRHAGTRSGGGDGEVGTGGLVDSKGNTVKAGDRVRMRRGRTDVTAKVLDVDMDNDTFKYRTISGDPKYRETFTSKISTWNRGYMTILE